MIKQTPDVSSWTVPIARWAIWDASKDGNSGPSSADLGFIEPMLRRRLSLLAKMALKVAHDCVNDLPSVRFVYASRHGELTRTTSMLEDLAAGESISPTSFSMSVLNSSAGVLSILRGDMAPSTAISASSESFGNGLLEAVMQLAEDPALPVLLVYADEPAPSVYGEIEPQDSSAHAIGLLLQVGATNAIVCNSKPSDKPLSREPQSRAFLRCLEGASGSIWQGASRCWAWSRAPQ